MEVPPVIIHFRLGFSLICRPLPSLGVGGAAPGITAGVQHFHRNCQSYKGRGLWHFLPALKLVRGTFCHPWKSYSSHKNAHKSFETATWHFCHPKAPKSHVYRFETATWNPWKSNSSLKRHPKASYTVSKLLRGTLDKATQAMKTHPKTMLTFRNSYVAFIYRFETGTCPFCYLWKSHSSHKKEHKSHIYRFELPRGTFCHP